MNKELYLAIQYNDEDSACGSFAGVYDNFEAANEASDDGHYKGTVWVLDLTQVKSIYVSEDDE